MIDVTSSPYNAVPDVTNVSNTEAIEAAIDQAISNGGDEIYFPPGRYELKASCPPPGSAIGPVSRDVSNIKLYGVGAVIVCNTNKAAGGNGSGGGFALKGDNIVIEGLSFEGKLAEFDSLAYEFGKLVRLEGDYNTVQNCYFKDGNGGAVVFLGNYNVITQNVFNKCNNHIQNNDYGAIHIYSTIPSPSKYNTISENKIFDQYYSGISVKGSAVAGGLAYLDISNNYIRSYSTFQSSSMGVYMHNGANRDIKIHGNTIEKIDAEAIIIFSNEDWEAERCMITNNIIRDCNYQGISLNSGGSDGNFYDCIIKNNIIENTCLAPRYDHQIYLDRVRDSLVTNNKCIGYKDRENYNGKGIALSMSPLRVQVNDNQLRGLKTGISFLSGHGALKDNHVYDCEIGITLGYCRGASVVGNVTNSCVTGINYADFSSPLHIVASALVDCTSNYSGTVVPEVASFSGRASGVEVDDYDPFVVTGTLVYPGEQDVSFGRIYDGDRFIVMPGNESGSPIDAFLFVSLIDKANNRVYIKSTDTDDTRDFTVIKMTSGG